jgi:16S rRNA U1498 N3-methylase RsmE
MCRSTNRPGNALESEVNFRIVHIAREGGNVTPAAALSRTNVRVVLGPEGGFENSDIVALAGNDPRRIQQRMPGT